MRIDKNKFGVLFILLIGVGFFYWFQVRPAQIKHDCSWVQRHQNSIPAEPGLTQEEIDKECNKTYENSFLKKLACGLSPRSSTPAIPAKDWWGPATPQEYSFCLHDKGL